MVIAESRQYTGCDSADGKAVDRKLGFPGFESNPCHAEANLMTSNYG